MNDNMKLYFQMDSVPCVFKILYEFLTQSQKPVYLIKPRYIYMQLNKTKFVYVKDR